MTLKASLEHSQKVKLQTKGEAPLLGWFSQSVMCLVSALLRKLALVSHPCLMLYHPQPPTITQGGKFAFNWLLTYPCPSVCLLFTFAVWKSRVFPFTFHSAGETGLLSSLLISTAWDPLSQTLPSTIRLYYLIAVSFSSSCYYEISTGSFWPKTTQEWRSRGGGEQLLDLRRENWRKLGKYPQLRVVTLSLQIKNHH